VTIDDRVLVLMSTTKDGQRTSQALLKAGLECHVCKDMAELCREIAVGAGAALLTEEMLAVDHNKRLAAALANQPAWSDFPLVIIAHEGSVETTAAYRETMNVSLVERPVRFRSLQSVVRAALRARRRQYEVRGHLASQEQHAEALRVILESITDAFVAVGRDWRITYVNQQAEELLSRNPGDLIGQVLWEAYPGLIGGPFEQAYRQAAAGSSNSLTAFYPDHNRWYEAHAYPSADGITIYFRDVTARKRSEEQIARLSMESERQRRLYEAALSNTADFNYTFDLQGRFTFANAALLSLWNKTLGEAVGKNFLELGYPPELAERMQQQIQQVIETRQILRDETPFASDSGTRTYEYIFVPVIGADGSVEAAAGSTRDITDRKILEETLREADRRKDEFLALLAHELRNPLAPLRNGLQIMRLAQGNETAVARARDMMERQLEHMVRLIDDLLDISRISRNKMELRKSRILLADVVSVALETALPAIDAGSHELIVSLPPTPVHLEADLTRLSQVFGNLLSNSAKYTQAGGKIWLTAERCGEEVVVRVRDNGIGIPEESLASIFDMFSQVDRSIERSAGGLGIGLALVKGLTEMHGGSVSVESGGPGAGTTFTVRLPVLREEREEREAPSCNGDVGSASGRQILVVDDNADGAESLAMMLELGGNRVVQAHDGLEALEQAERLHPEVILMDLGMPRMNGLEATRRIRAQDWGKGITIIALTGWGQEADRQRSREAGCDGHLVKPVKLPDLQSLLEKLAR
jgi:PAS domain S-box-containing protein